MPCEPKFAVVFCSSSMYDHKLAVTSRTLPGSSRFPRAAKKERVEIVDYLHRLLPPACRVVGTATDGIVGTNPLTLQASELENNEESMSCLLVPDIKGLTITHFIMTPEKEARLEPYIATADLMAPHRDLVSSVLGVPRGEQPKLVLLFETETEQSVSRAMDIDYMLLKTYENVVIAGGYVNNIFPDAPVTGDEAAVGEINTMGLVFTGDNIKVASVILNQRIHDKSVIEQKLKKLKDCHVPGVNQVGFMFACVGRGAHFHKEKNLESSVFRTMFPKAPLFGFFGNGEIGYDYLPDYSSVAGDSNYTLLGEYPDDETGVVFDMPAINHSYTTVFVLVSLGKN